MKPQDLAFVLSLIPLTLTRRPALFIWAGLASLALAIPLFASWVFFTAERLTWYAAGYFALSIFFFLLRPGKVQ